MNHIAVSDKNEPYINLAIEEYYLKQVDNNEMTIFCYVNNKSIVIGKHQNYLKEIDYKYILNHNIPIYRRLSGGGAVYHDTGNINIAFIKNQKEGFKNHKHSHFSQIIINFLNDYKIKTSLGERNEILLDNCKISGSSQYIYKNNIIHHLTLLIDADLEELSKALKQNSYDNYNDKHVNSINSKVKNVANKDINLTNVTQYLKNQFNAQSLDINYKDPTLLNIINDKYLQDDWNLFYNNNYQFHKSLLDGLINISIEVKNSYITDFKIKIKDKLIEVSEANNKRHTYNSLESILSMIYNNHISPYNLINQDFFIFKCF